MARLLTFNNDGEGGRLLTMKGSTEVECTSKEGGLICCPLGEYVAVVTMMVEEEEEAAAYLEGGSSCTHG